MPSIFSNPNVMQMAGLAVMSGARVGDAIKEAVTQDAMMQRQANEAQQMQYQQQQMAQDAAAQEALASSDLSGFDPRVAALLKSKNIEAARLLQGMLEKEKQQNMMSSLLGGEGGTNPEGIAAAGVMIGNPALVQFGQFKQSNADKAAEKEKSLKEVSVQGFDIAPDTMPTADDAKKLKEISAAKKELDVLLNGLYEMVETSGTELFGNKSREMGGKVAQIKGVAKNLEALGALSGDDLRLVEDMISDPTSVNAALTGTDSIKKGILGYGDYITQKINSSASARGYIPKDNKPFYQKAEGNAPAAAVKALKDRADQFKAKYGSGKAPAAAVEDLKSLSDQFKAKYGYLPEGF